MPEIAFNLLMCCFILIFFSIMQMISWSDFCKDAFAKKNNVITIVDQSKFNWKCTMQFVEEDNRLVCKIGGDWEAICALRNFVVGHAIKLGVCDDKGSDVVFLRHVPLECTHRCYIRPPSASINEKYVYEVNHYFLSCPKNSARNWM